MNAADFPDYLRCFSEGDFEGLGKYYAADVVLELPRDRMVGRETILNFYRDMRRRVHETLTADMVLANDEALFADVAMEFRCIVDAPDFVVAPMKVGEVIRGRIFALYIMGEGGKVVQIKTARYGDLQGPMAAS
ncbi:MAG: nuclear transport factor 2 family protein [Caulobacteraceae bacterium]